MIIKYDAVPTTIKVGVPFTWGNQVHWYIKSTSGELVKLKDGSTYGDTEAHIIEVGNLKYAKSMELK